MKDSKNKILVVDDDTQHLRDVKHHLESVGYEVATADDGVAALKLANTFFPDLVVLDINFTSSKATLHHTMDGLDVLRRLRDSGSVPVLMLSATNIAAVKVMALTVGADDYLAKPFDPRELSARIAAILRRGGSDLREDKVLTFRRLQLDPGERRVLRDGKPVELTGIEFDILYALARRPEHVFSREKIIEHAWKGDTCCVAKAVDVHVGHIRKKIEDDPAHPSLVITVRGTGYRFEDAPAAS